MIKKKKIIIRRKNNDTIPIVMRNGVLVDTKDVATREGVAALSSHPKRVLINKKRERVRLNRENECVICKHQIEGRKVNIGNNLYRCYDCYPGSPSWLESEVGKNSKYRHYFTGVSIMREHRKVEEAVVPNKPKRVRVAANVEAESKPKRVMLKKTKRVLIKR